MKILPTLSIFILMSNFCHPEEPSIELAKVMERNSEGDKAEEIREIWEKIPTEKQPQMLEATIHRLQDISKDPKINKKVYIPYIGSAAWILTQFGTDDQIVSAFGNLSDFGLNEDNAGYALGACKGAGGVGIMETLAEKRLSSLYVDWHSLSEDDKKKFDDEALGPFFELIKSLYNAKHPSGPIAALRLRDKLAAKPPSVFGIKLSDGREYGNFFLDDLNKRLGRIRERRLKEDPSLELPPLESSSTQKEPPNKSLRTSPETVPIKADRESVSFLQSYWQWIVGGVLLLFAALIFRMRSGTAS